MASSIFLGWMGFMPNNFVPFRSHCLRRVRGRCVFILCLVAKNEARKHTKGQALWKPARLRRAPFAPSVARYARKGGAKRYGSAKQLPSCRRLSPRWRWAGSEALCLDCLQKENSCRFYCACGRRCIPRHLRERFQPNSPNFAMLAVSSPKVGHRSPAQPVLEAVPNKTENLC